MADSLNPTPQTCGFTASGQHCWHERRLLRRFAKVPESVLYEQRCCECGAYRTFEGPRHGPFSGRNG